MFLYKTLYLLIFSNIIFFHFLMYDQKLTELIQFEFRGPLIKRYSNLFTPLSKHGELLHRPTP